jgi:hypothetical protein
MILQKTYHKLQEWIIMLNAEAFENTDADLVREEMIKHCGEIWMKRTEEDTLNAKDGNDKEGEQK